MARQGAKPSQSQGRVEHDELHAVAKSRQAEIQLPHNVHFTDAGYAALAAAAVATIEPALSAR